MSQKKQFIKGGMWLTVGYGLSAVFSFLRNIILARLVSVEDYGIASLFAIVMSVIEMLSDIAIDKLLIQTNSRNMIDLQSVGHAFQAFRGVVGGFVLFFLAIPIAELFNAPEAYQAFQWFALVPVIRGFAHLDIQLFQRDLQFIPVALSNVIPQFVSLLVLIVIGQFIRDYSVIIWVVIIQNICFVFFTFYFAKNEYRWLYQSDLLKQILRFGWPLLANGLLMFIIMQGDKAVVGIFFSKEELGWYSAAFALTLAPTMLITKILSSLLLPVVSNVQSNVDSFFKYYVLTMQTCCLAGLATALFFIYLGPNIFVLLFGDKYFAASTLVIWLGITQGFRVIKSGPMIMAMAKAETKNALMSNLVRAASFIILLIAIVVDSTTIHIVAIIGLVGEFFALLMSVYYLKSRLHLFDKKIINQLLCVTIYIVVAILSVEYLNSVSVTTLNFVLKSLLFILLTVSYFCVFTVDLKRHLGKYFLNYRSSKLSK